MGLPERLDLADQDVRLEAVGAVIQASDAIYGDVRPHRIGFSLRLVPAGVPVSRHPRRSTCWMNRGELARRDGSSWNPLTPGLVDQRSLPFTHRTVSGVLHERIGGIILRGVLKRRDDPRHGQPSNIGVVGSPPRSFTADFLRRNNQVRQQGGRRRSEPIPPCGYDCQRTEYQYPDARRRLRDHLRALDDLRRQNEFLAWLGGA